MALMLTAACICWVQYDTDVVTWSPQGRIHQIEYAMEAVKQGSAAVGLKVVTRTACAAAAQVGQPLPASAHLIPRIGRSCMPSHSPATLSDSVESKP